MKLDHIRMSIHKPIPSSPSPYTVRGEWGNPAIIASGNNRSHTSFDCIFLGQEYSFAVIVICTSMRDGVARCKANSTDCRGNCSIVRSLGVVVFRFQTLALDFAQNFRLESLFLLVLKLS